MTMSYLFRKPSAFDVGTESLSIWTKSGGTNGTIWPSIENDTTLAEPEPLTKEVQMK